ncbi:MAG: hypothetical protein CMF49_00890 [Legionellales bacterium]|nr:hypothetical protein [Legionellales bacterium]
MSHSNGFTLIELLIAVVLGTFITLVLGELFIEHQQSFKFQQALMQASHNGILASNLLQTMTENAGFTGCLSLKNLVIDNHVNGLVILPAKILSTGSMHKKWTHQPLATSSLLQLNYMSPDTDLLSKAMLSAHYLTVEQHVKLKAGDIVMIADCTHADLFQVDKVYQKKDTQVLYTRSTLSAYRKGAEVGLWQAPILYIANTTRLDRLGKPIPALYWHTISGRDEELIEGISQFHVSLDTSTQAEKLAFNLETMSIDTVGHVPKSQSLAVHPYHVSQHWQFLDYVG